MEEYAIRVISEMNLSPECQYYKTKWATTGHCKTKPVLYSKL